MLQSRVIPCLLLKGLGLVKGQKFSNHTYVGDPINAVKIFNDKEVDELLFLDISATAEKRTPPIELVAKIADQCLMPFGVGGGIRTVDEARSLLKVGAEKVCICTAAADNPNLISEIANCFGTQSVMVSVDVKKDFWGKSKVFTRCGSKNIGMTPVEFAKQSEKFGAGEILINSIERDGTMQGYDLELIKEVSSAVSIPVIACGGAGSYSDLKKPLTEAHASAVSAGALFVFHGPRRAVLINYPDEGEIKEIRSSGQI